MASSLFSIIIPVYNTERYIERCLKSIIEQRVKDVEIIIINDGSEDNAEQIILEMVKKHEDIIFKYYKQNNKGLSAARNKGLELAEGKYIIWLDSDDELNDDALDSLEKLAVKNPDIIINRIISRTENNEYQKECEYIFKDEDIKNKKQLFSIISNIRGFWYAAWCLVVKKSLLDDYEIRFKDGIYHEDELWTPQVLCKGKTFCCNSYPYYINTSMRRGSIIARKNIKKEFDKLINCKELNKYCGSVEEGQEVKFLKKRIFIILYTVYAEMAYYRDHIDYNKLDKQLFNTIKNIYGCNSWIVRLTYYVRKKIG